MELAKPLQIEVDINLLTPSPHHVRGYRTSASRPTHLRHPAFLLFKPIVVRRASSGSEGARFEIVDGVKRWLTAKEHGLANPKGIRVTSPEHDDQDTYKLSALLNAMDGTLAPSARPKPCSSCYPSSCAASQAGNATRTRSSK